MNDDEILRVLRGTESEEVLLEVDAEGRLSGGLAREVGGHNRMAEAAGDLERLGLVQIIRRMVVLLIEPTSKGRRVAGLIRTSRTEGADWFDAIERAVAAAVLSPTTEGSWRIKEVNGRPVSEAHLEAAVARLKKWECVRTVSSWDGPSLLKAGPYLAEVPGVRGLLRDHFENRSSTPVYDNRSYSFMVDKSIKNDKSSTINNITSVSHSTVGNVAAGGEGNVQHSVQTITSDERTQILEVLEKLRADMGQGMAPEVVEAVEVIESEAQSETVTKAGLKEKIVAALVTASAHEGIQLVAGHLNELLGIVS